MNHSYMCMCYIYIIIIIGLCKTYLSIYPSPTHAPSVYFIYLSPFHIPISLLPHRQHSNVRYIYLCICVYIIHIHIHM